jgi:hypothetical protein
MAHKIFVWKPPDNIHLREGEGDWEDVLRWTEGKQFVGWEMDRTSSGLCPIMVFGITTVQSSPVILPDS